MLLDRIHSSDHHPGVDSLNATAMMAMATYALGSDENHDPEAILDLHTVEPTRINPEQLATVLRTLSSIRHDILGYNYALGQCKNACFREHIDPHDVLFGLIDEKDTQ